MASKFDHSWLRKRLENRAKDARQAEQTALKLWHPAYPDAKRLAQVHGEAAEVYERALLALDNS